jgi:hypothetical protein
MGLAHGSRDISAERNTQKRSPDKEGITVRFRDRAVTRGEAED